MIPKNFLIGNPLLSVRTALYADSATKSPFQHLIQDVVKITRRLLRNVCKSKSSPSEIYRRQHRLPVEYFKENVVPAQSSKFKFFSYKPGNIYRLTSRWCFNSLTNSWRTDLIRKFYRGGSGPMICFVGFVLAKKPSILTEEEEMEGVSYLIRDSFSSLAFKKEILNIDKIKSLSNISDLKFGELIAKGCNAAIYSACVSENIRDLPINNYNPGIEDNGMNADLLNSSSCVSMSAEENRLLEERMELKEKEKKHDETFTTEFFMCHSEGQQSQDSNIQEVVSNLGNFGSYDIAVKVMFNYSAESNAFAIWNAMYKETLPLFGEFSLGDIWKTELRKKLKPHPNIVKMYSAFADQLPLLPGATKNFPQALPTRLLMDGCGRNMTLFLAMKRYHCSLKEYLKSQLIKPETSLLLLTQLLEALVHLYQNGVAHRDLKSDNILLDLSAGIACPKLTVTDFGCCLENLSLPYTSYDINKGGNMTLMAPEVVNCEPGPFSTIDYSRADLWAAGTIAYEIFSGTNPFYSNSNVKNNSYAEKDLPSFPSTAPPAVKKLVRNMLQVNPSQRPSQNFAATVCQLLLHSPPSFLIGPFTPKVGKKALSWMFQLSARTYLEASMINSEDMSVNLELKSTFCSRIQYLEMIEALQFILEV